MKICAISKITKTYFLSESLKYDDSRKSKKKKDKSDFEEIYKRKKKLAK